MAEDKKDKKSRRKLTTSEQSLFPKDFRSKIKIGNVTMISRAHNPFASGKILTRNNDIYWPDCPEDFIKEGMGRKSLLMHELCHVWQYHTGRLTAVGYLTSPSGWSYEYSFDPKKSFDDYPTEKQADLLQDWYRMNSGSEPKNYKTGTTKPTLSQINKTVPFKW